MVRGAIEYKDVWLAPGSVAYALHEDRKGKDWQKKLDAHIKEVWAKADALERFSK